MPVKDFDDIPGTYVFDSKRCVEGYHLNMFCKSLDKAENREAFRADPGSYLDRYPMTAEQRQAVEARDYLRMLHVGGNVYYLFKLANNDRVSMQHIGSSMTGMSVEEFQAVLAAGGLGVDGSRPETEET